MRFAESRSLSRPLGEMPKAEREHALQDFSLAISLTYNIERDAEGRGV